MELVYYTNVHKNLCHCENDKTFTWLEIIVASNISPQPYSGHCCSHIVVGVCRHHGWV